MNLNIEFLISNPSDDWKRVYEKGGKFFFPHKFWEFNVYKDSSSLGFIFNVTTQTHHAGMLFRLCFIYKIEFIVYDDRHWDYENNCFEDY